MRSQLKITRTYLRGHRVWIRWIVQVVCVANGAVIEECCCRAVVGIVVPA